MPEILSEGLIIPLGTDNILKLGVEPTRDLGKSSNTALEGKSDVGHQHTVEDITDFDATLAEALADKMDVEATELSGQDANTLTTPGVYYESSSSQTGPNFPEPRAGVFTVTANAARSHVHQQFITFGTGTRYYVRARYNGSWSEWKQLATDEMLATAIEEVETGLREPMELGTQHLDDVKDPGLWTQDFSADATEERGYPAEGTRAGRLFVQSNTFRTQVTQQYITYDTNQYMLWFVRNFYLEWGEWQIVPLGGGGGDTGGGFSDEELGDVSLDTVVDPGTYSQQFSSYATEALGYPPSHPRAGRLLVQANGSRSQVTQMYVTFDTTSNVGFLLRNFYSTWSEWWQIPLFSADDGGGGGGGGAFELHGTIPDGTDINTLDAPGVYSVPTTAVAGTLINWPTNRAGILQVGSNNGSNMTSQQVIAYVTQTSAPEQYTRAKLLLSDSSWGPWSTSEWVKGRVPEGTNVDEFRQLGAWMVVSGSDATGLPGSGQGLLEVAYLTGAGISLQRFTERIANDEVAIWARYSLLVGGWTGIEWSRVGGSGGGGEPGGAARTADVQVSSHSTRVEIEASRRGGSIGTDGVPVFMWRFDHWLVKFRDEILPILRRYGLPATLNVNYDNMDNPQNGAGSITWLDVQDWNQYDGIEIANHGSTHTNASTMEAIYHEVVEGKRNLEDAMPRVPVVTWQEHGSAYLVAGDLPGDTGLDLGRTVESFTESYAGRLIAAEHAVIEGKFASFYPPVTGRPQIGQSHYSMDRQTHDESVETIEFVQEVGRGMTAYTHPGLMDMVNIDGSLYQATYREDGTARLDYPTEAEGAEFNSETDLRNYVGNLDGIVHMPVKDFEATCAWIAAERDAGRLMVMTAAGGGFADISHARRENILMRSGWSSTGWTISGTGADYVATSGASASEMSQGMLLYTRFGWAMGAAHELLVWARADAETTLTLAVEESSDPSLWASQKVHTVPGDGVLRPYRLNITLPRNNEFRNMTVRVGGPSLTIEGEPLLAAI